LHAGRVKQAGQPAELYARPIDREIASFLGDALVLPATLGDGFADCALGRISADSTGRTGEAIIMLRPEQLKLSAATGQQTSHARVTTVEFGGAHCVMTVSLAGSKVPLIFKTSAVETLAVGTDVHISVTGKAHVFA
jgi:iron(III) transport system ATP-binding protein